LYDENVRREPDLSTYIETVLGHCQWLKDGIKDAKGEVSNLSYATVSGYDSCYY
jgi:hypothetical protein